MVLNLFILFLARQHSTGQYSLLPGPEQASSSVKAIILKYDQERRDYIEDDLDNDRHLVIKESQLQNLKAHLGRVS